jgi:hypothetical protein
MKSVNQSLHGVLWRLSRIGLTAVFWVSNPPTVGLGLGEPLAETIRSVTIGHQFPFTEKLAFLSVRSSFAVLDMSVALEEFCSTFSSRGCSTGFAVHAVAQCALFHCSGSSRKL